MAKRLDSEFFEIVVIYNMLTDPEYLGSVIDVLQPRFFKNKNIGQVVDIIETFFVERNAPPTITEIKSQLHSGELKEAFRDVVNQFKDIDTKFNRRSPRK